MAILTTLPALAVKHALLPPTFAQFGLGALGGNVSRLIAIKAKPLPFSLALIGPPKLALTLGPGLALAHGIKPPSPWHGQ